jgi:hypothetical protein
MEVQSPPDAAVEKGMPWSATRYREKKNIMRIFFKLRHKKFELGILDESEATHSP